MKPGKKEKQKQKKAIFKAKYGYYPLSKTAPRRHYGYKRVVRDTRDYSRAENVKIIKSEDALFDIAKSGDYTYFDKPQLAAIKNPHLKDENKFLELINGDYEYHIRMAAVRRIRNDEILIGLLKNHSDWHVRYAALDSIHKIDESLINDVALNDEDFLVRREAVKYVKDQDTLVFISRNDEDAIVRIDALKKIRNMDIVVYQAKNDPNWRVRIAAIELIKDLDILEGLLENEKDLFVQEAIEGKLENLTKQKKFKKIDK